MLYFLHPNPLVIKEFQEFQEGILPDQSKDLCTFLKTCFLILFTKLLLNQNPRKLK